MMNRGCFRGVAVASLIVLACSMTAGCRYDAESGAEAIADASADTQAGQAAAAAKMLGGRLKARLVETMQAEGPVAAIEVCNVEAPVIAADVGTALGLDVGRTSLQVRNVMNRPEPRERKVLVRWAEAVAAGTPVGELAPHVEGADDSFLWMKPIGVEGPCLVCHGETISEPVATAIAARYPSDRATGYRLGDLRGAFVVKGNRAAQ